MEELNIKSDTLNKGIDLVAESSIETRKTFDKSVSGGLSKLFALLNATPLGIKLDTYIAERPYKLELSMKRMQAKYQQIPVENQVEPSSYIALKGVNELSYALDEEYLREMFENLLISDMDSQKKNKVLPAYIEIVKQLSKKDAEILKHLKTLQTLSHPIIKLKLNTLNGGYYIPSNDILLIDKEKYTHIPAINIDNLARLKIIDIDFMSFINDASIYINAFNYFKDEGPLNFIDGIPESLNYSKGLLHITDFGKRFIDICLS